MKKILLFSMGMYTGIMSAQNSSGDCPKLIVRSSQISDNLCDTTIRNVRILASDRVVVKYKNATKRYVDTDSVWGIRQKDGTLKRVYFGEWYEVSKLSPIVTYSQRVGKSTNYYFSSTPDSSIYSYTQRTLQKHIDSVTYSQLKEETQKNRRELSFGLYGLQTQILENDFWGAGIEMTYFPKKRWGSGLSFLMTGKKMSTSFSFPATRPVFNYMEVGWLNEIVIVSGNRFRANFEFATGFIYAELRDKAQIVEEHTKNGHKKTAKLISSDYYFLTQPGASFSFKVLNLNHYPDIYLTAKAKYRLPLGNAEFGNGEINAGYCVLFGLTLIGFDKEPL